MVPIMTDQNALKRAVAAKALDYVQDGMKLGLGSTARHRRDFRGDAGDAGALAEQKLLCVPTSERTAALARKLGLTLSSLDDLAPWISPLMAPTKPTAIST